MVAEDVHRPRNALLRYNAPLNLGQQLRSNKHYSPHPFCTPVPLHFM